jgi:hypothetical protein
MAEKKPTSKRGLWFKLGRFITGLTLACFFLPFFGVSCEGMDIVTMSGADMAFGCKPGGLMAEAEEQGEKMGGGMGGEKADMGLEKVPVEPLAIVALALAAIVFGLSWLKTRQGMTAVAVASVACIGALIGLWIKVGGDMKDQITSQMLKKNGMGGDEASEMANDMTREVMKDTKVDSGSRMGLYLSIAGLVGALGLCVLALKEPEGTELQPQTPPPPGPAPGGYGPPGGGYPPPGGGYPPQGGGGYPPV